MNLRYFIFPVLCLIISCGPSMKQEDLYGKWKYVKVENPERGQGQPTTGEELQENDPSVSFSPDGNLEMWWGGKVLSHGTYKLEYPNIVYTELLPGGSTRNIRFLIKKFGNNELVFQTQEADPVRVTARKEGK
ncbi:hypothetical protein [Arcticibacter sp. MXS-1]|uniref:hypothetical protein n=1 Tax=Arcticibacter sp. MXS-1 TaxID=3341726 RepID=UPI0035A84553